MIIFFQAIFSNSIFQYDPLILDNFERKYIFHLSLSKIKYLSPKIIIYAKKKKKEARRKCLFISIRTESNQLLTG